MFRLLKKLYPSLSTKSKPHIVRSHDWLLFLKGRQLLSECQDAVQKAELFIDEVYKKEKERGYQEGIAQARVDMAAEQVRFSNRLNHHFEKVETDLSHLVCQLVEKIIGSIPEQERVIRIIKRAMDNLKNQERAKIYVRPEHVEAVYTSIRNTYRNYSAPESLVVEPNSSLSGDQCVIESGGLVIEISLASHIEALKKSLHISERVEEPAHD